MASLAIMIGRAAINALVLSRSNYQFLKLSDHGQEEQKRHHLAMEDFQKARNERNKERLEKINFISKRLHDHQLAKHIITDLKEPVLIDLYHTSKDQKKVEIMFIISETTYVSYLVFRYI